MLLQRHSDGSWRTANGFAIVVMLRGSGKVADGSMRVFEFVAGHYAPPIRIVWEGDAAVIDATLLPVMIANGYARNLTEEEAAATIRTPRQSGAPRGPRARRTRNP